MPPPCAAGRRRRPNAPASPQRRPAPACLRELIGVNGPVSTADTAGRSPREKAYQQRGRNYFGGLFGIERSYLRGAHVIAPHLWIRTRSFHPRGLGHGGRDGGIGSIAVEDREPIQSRRWLGMAKRNCLLRHSAASPNFFISQGAMRRQRRRQEERAPPRSDPCRSFCVCGGRGFWGGRLGPTRLGPVIGWMESCVSLNQEAALPARLAAPARSRDPQEGRRTAAADAGERAGVRWGREPERRMP